MMSGTSLTAPFPSDQLMRCHLNLRRPDVLSIKQKPASAPRIRPFKLLCRSSATQTTLNALYMEDAYDALVERAITNSKDASNKRYIIGVAGVPGGGKSTLARDVCRLINLKIGSEIAVNVPMDGFHYYKKELDQMPNPTEAYARRGAHWTFDATAFVHCLKSVKFESGRPLFAPSFDHGVGDPKPGAIKVLPQHKIVISEGNYLLLDVDPWCQLWRSAKEEKTFNDTWYVDCDLNVAMQRVFSRQTGNGVAAEVSRGRIEGNDRPNGELIASTKSRADVVIPSLPFKQAR